MSEGITSSAWLELPDGQKIPLARSCAIGRSRSNQLVLADTRVSRQHAVIQAQGEGKFLIVDFGSANGTRLNGRRVVLPTELRDGSNLDIAGVQMVFRQAGRLVPEDIERTTTTLTVREVRRFSCWLLVVDIIDSTLLFRTTAPDELPQVVGHWFMSCRELLEQRGGVINQYTGDGFFAHWPDVPASHGTLVESLRGLEMMQKQHSPAFRWVLHLGSVSSGGSLQPGEENLMGPEVHFVFRMESLSKVLNRPILFSDPAAQRLKGELPLKEVGQYELKGFEGRFAFHGY